MGEIADRVQKTKALHERVERLSEQSRSFINYDPRNPGKADAWRPLVAMERWLETLAKNPEYVEEVFNFGEDSQVAFFNHRKGDGQKVIKEALALLSEGLPKDVQFQPPLKVRAIARGQYGGAIREPGETFEIKRREEFGRWMEVVGKEKSKLPVEELERLVNVRWRLPRPEMVLQSIVYGARDDDGYLRAEKMTPEQYELLDRFESLLKLAMKEEQTVAPTSVSHIAGRYDVFICHASEDKDECVRPLAQRLRDLGLAVWYDEFEMTIGDSLSRKIDEGLQSSSFGVVVLSPSFFRKDWPKRELDGLYSKEVGGRKVILPIWFQIGFEGVSEKSPLLAGRVAGRFSEGLDKVAQDLLRAMGKQSTNPTLQVREPVPAKPPDNGQLQVKMVRRRWVSEGPAGLPPLYVELEFDYVSEKPDAVKSVVAVIAGITVEADQSRGFPQFGPVAHVRWLFKFIPQDYRNASENIPITIETSRGLAKTITIVASPGSYTGTWPELRFENGFEVVTFGSDVTAVAMPKEILTAHATKAKWVIRRQGPSSLYVTVELNHQGTSSDAVNRVTARIYDYDFKADDGSTYPKLDHVDFKEHTFTFSIERWHDTPYDIPIGIRSVRDKSATTQVKITPGKYAEAPNWIQEGLP